MHFDTGLCAGCWDERLDELIPPEMRAEFDRMILDYYFDVAGNAFTPPGSWIESTADGKVEARYCQTCDGVSTGFPMRPDDSCELCRLPPVRKRAKKKRVRKLVLDLHAAQDGQCGICGQAIDDLRATHVDHIIPRAKGGSDRLTNLQLAHARCNTAKGDRFEVVEG
ncbi:MAG: HNH endonuclease signature motif containing protein [Chloroflexota bacterium]|nr:HNH endonuclease signature motif containing protein [Chloroflexota bacterium]